MSGEPASYANTVLGDLTDVIDDLRSLHEEFGTRLYRVFLVWVQWSGGVRGQGTATIDERLELRPIPRTYDDVSIPYRYSAGGAVREGDWLVTEISLNAATAELLRGERNGLLTPPAIEFYWELHAIRPGGKVLRFRVAGEPIARPTEWAVSLRHENPDTPSDGNSAPVVRF